MSIVLSGSAGWKQDHTPDWTGLEWVVDQQWLNTIENIEYTQRQKLDGVV